MNDTPENDPTMPLPAHPAPTAVQDVLPKSAGETAVAQWGASVRGTFGRDRRGFNFAICDALAAQGIQPSANGVLRVGRWGQAASIAQDVNEWYRTLAERLSSLEARIPIAARRQANTLLEQLFAVAGSEAARTLDAQLQPLRDENARAHAALKEAQYREQQLQEEKHALAEAQGLAQQRLQDLQGQLDSVQLALDELHARHARATSESQAARQQLQAELLAVTARLHEQLARGELAAAAAKEQLACVREEHAQAMLKASQQADAERRHLLQGIDNLRVESAARLKELQAELGRARERIEALQEKAQNSALATATAQALHEGAVKLLERERELFAQAQARYEALPYRQELLLEFLAHFAQAGLRIGGKEADQSAVAAWLSAELGLQPVAVKQFMQGVEWH